MQDTMYAQFPDVTERREKQALFALVSASGATNHLRQMVVENPSLIGQTVQVVVPASDQVDQLLKGYIDRDLPEARRPKMTDAQIVWIDTLVEKGVIKKKFNTILFTNPDSRDPELAGIASAVVGSVMIVLISFILALPIGVGAAIYLDEFAPKNRFTDLIEININNLAAVPSIVFGLLGLAVFINFFGFQRSIPLVGGMVLALRAFPTIVIATRASLRAVSPSMVNGALSLGASHIQAVFQQKVPLAAPGILTGSIIAMAQVLGETAPLLMIGMVAFVTEVPNSVTDPATALPVQIFLWSDSAERAWSERTAAAIIILLLILVTMNALAIWLRTRLEKRR
jgi:phosphate transport system permease protein